MSHSNQKTWNVATRLLQVAGVMTLVAAGAAQAAAPGIKAATLTTNTSTFNLNAAANLISQPDGQQIYSWGYGCTAGTGQSFAPFTPAEPSTACPDMQVPGPTLIVTEGATVTVTLKNSLPASAGNTSIVFSGFKVTSPASPAADAGVPGLRAQEAPNGGTVTYTFVASTPGTHSYYSGTQSDLQIEMGLYGAVIVLPKTPATSLQNPLCSSVAATPDATDDYRLASSAYDHPATCYDREYLFQFAELDPKIHKQAEAVATCKAGGPSPCATMNTVVTEPYHPAYFLINGRSMPDDMDANYAPNYPRQPYNGNPHMHPGELVLLRVIGQGRAEHPFHEHANHVRILARDGNLLTSQTDPTKLAGLMMFTTDTFPGQAFDGLFYWSGKGLNWDIYGHTPGNKTNPVCNPDSAGYFTTASTPTAAIRPTYSNGVMAGSANYYEWCADHNHPLEVKPVGAVGAGGPATLPDPLVMTNGLWYNGTPYLGQDAVNRAQGPTPLPPGGALQNPPAESGIAFMWHSHNEREITTNDVFPGGMLMMMLVDPWAWYIDETL
jgi:FtsP/CotA-like multicopper oxidase with cupredoxin domain